jgi:hypothetical protein
MDGVLRCVGCHLGSVVERARGRATVTLGSDNPALLAGVRVDCATL